MANIVYLAGSKIPSRAANAVQTMKMCAAFVGQGHTVDLFCRAGDEGDAFESFGVERSFNLTQLPPHGPRGTRTATFLAEVNRRARGLRADVYFARDVYALAALASTGRPLVFEAHRSMAGFRLERAVFAWLHRQVNFRKLIVVSQAMKREYLAMFPSLRQAKVQVLPGAASGLAPPGGVNPWRVRESALQVGYVGQLYQGRGVEIIAKLAELRPEMDFHVVGGDAVDIESWRRRATSSNLRFHGFVSHAELEPRLSSFDILLAPYQREVFVSGGAETSKVMSPLKVFEYMSTGAAIVCSDLPVLREVLEQERTAIMVSPADVDQWSETLIRLRSPELRKKVGAAAKARFIESHTWSARAKSALAGVVTAA